MINVNKKFGWLGRILAGLMAIALVVLMAVSSMAATTTGTIDDGGEYYSGSAYFAPIKIAGSPVTRTVYNKYKWKVTVDQGKSYLEEYKIDKDEDVYGLSFETKRKSGGDYKTVSGTIRATDKTTKEDIDIDFEFEILYGDKEYVDSDEITLKEKESRTLTFEEGTEEATITFDKYAEFEVEITRDIEVDLRYSTDDVDAIVNANPSADLQFLTFKGKPSFHKTGTFTGICDLAYLYSYDANGNVTLLAKDTYDEEPEYETKTLGWYVFSDKPLVNGNGTSASTNNGNNGTKPTSGTTVAGTEIGLSIAGMNAMSAPTGFYMFTTSNAESYITPAGYNSIKSVFSGKHLVFRRMDANGSVIAQTMLPVNSSYNLTSNFKVGISDPITDTPQMFKKWFNINMVGFRTAQTGNFNTPVEYAIKLNLNGMDTSKLKAWVYDKAANSYYTVVNPKISVDSAGYLHITIQRGGDVLISDGTL